MQRFETKLDQMAWVAGVRHNGTPLISIAESGGSAALEAHKGRLYILIEADLSRPNAAQICQLAIRTIRREYYGDNTYSMTAALRAALRAANKAIYERSVGQSPQQRVQVGCTCAVIKDGELHLALVQPAQIYILHDGQLRAIPAHPSWDPVHQTAAPFVRGNGLGASLFIEPELFRSDFRANDRAIICSSLLGHVLGRQDALGLLKRAEPTDQMAALAELAAERECGDFYALALLAEQVVPKVPTIPIAAEQHLPEGHPWWGQLLDRLRGTPARSALREPAPDAMQRLPVQPSHSATPPPRPAPIELGESLSERYDRHRRNQPRPSETPTLPPSTFLGEHDYTTPARAIDLGDAPTIAAGARIYRPRYELRPLVDMTWPERLSMPFRWLLYTGEDLWRASKVRRTGPPQRTIPRGKGLSYRRTSPPFPWVALLGTIVVVALLIGYGTLLSQENNSRLAEEYLSIAEQRLAEVRAAPDEVAALERLDIASKAIDEVLATPEVTRTNAVLWTRYQELQREYERSLAAVQRLTFFDDPQVLATHPIATSRFSSVVVPAQLSGITDTAVLEGLGYVYALDADNANAQLYRIPLEGGVPQPYLSPNQSVGTTVVGPLRAALWRLDQAVALDFTPSGSGYYFRQGSGWNYSKLGASEIWNIGDRLDVEEYDGNLYLWGAQPGEVLKYTSGQYGDTPEFWLQTGGAGDNDLTSVVDMAVDGSIYLLQPNGTVLVFSLGQVVGSIEPQGLIPPIGTVSRMVVTGTPDNGSIFLIEPTAERIIQIDKTSGELIQQIKLRPGEDLQLNDLAALTIDDSGAKTILYIVNGGRIIRADLPSPPRSFREQAEITTP